MKHYFFVAAISLLSSYLANAQMQYGIFLEGSSGTLSYESPNIPSIKYQLPGFALGTKASYTFLDRLEVALLASISFNDFKVTFTDENGNSIGQENIYPVTANVPLQVSYLFRKDKMVRPLVFGSGGVTIRMNESDLVYDVVKPMIEIGTGANISFAKFNCRPEVMFRGGSSLFKQDALGVQSNLSQFTFRLVFQG